MKGEEGALIKKNEPESLKEEALIKIMMDFLKGGVLIKKNPIINKKLKELLIKVNQKGGGGTVIYKTSFRIVLQTS